MKDLSHKLAAVVSATALALAAAALSGPRGRSGGLRPDQRDGSRSDPASPAHLREQPIPARRAADRE